LRLISAALLPDYTNRDFRPSTIRPDHKSVHSRAGNARRLADVAAVGNLIP